MLCDLHTHSTFSDGTLTPTQLAFQTSAAGLGAVALCDHNTVNGLPEFVAAAQSANILPVPGIEFSTQWEEKELHILALFVRPEHYASIRQRLDDFLKSKEQSNRDLISNLRKAKICLDYDKIAATVPFGNVNRAVIGREMVRLGYCASVQEAFCRYLAPKMGYYTPAPKPDAWETVAFIHSMGCVAVLAHPLLTLTEPQLRRFLSQGSCLDAMEVYYSTYDAETTALAEKIAKEHGLLYSGGSDFHGENKPNIRLGKGQNNLSISMEVLSGLASVLKGKKK